MAWCSCGCLLMWHFKLFMLVVAKSQLQHLSDTQRKCKTLLKHRNGSWKWDKNEVAGPRKTNHNLSAFWRYIFYIHGLYIHIYMDCPTYTHILSLKEHTSCLQDKYSYPDFCFSLAQAHVAFTFYDTNHSKWDHVASCGAVGTFKCHCH